MHANHNPLYTVGTYALNYGVEKCRFPAPAFFTNRVRCVAVLEAAERHPKGWLLTMGNTLLLEGSDRPAMTCSWKVLFVGPA
jgi:acyl dehydratase